MYDRSRVPMSMPGRGDLGRRDFMRLGEVAALRGLPMLLLVLTLLLALGSGDVPESEPLEAST